jgi:hypothetical protein
MNSLAEVELDQLQMVQQPPAVDPRQQLKQPVAALVGVLQRCHDSDQLTRAQDQEPSSPPAGGGVPSGAQDGTGTRSQAATPRAITSATRAGPRIWTGSTKSTQPVAMATLGMSKHSAVDWSWTSTRPPARVTAQTPAAPSRSRPLTTTAISRGPQLPVGRGRLQNTRPWPHPYLGRLDDQLGPTGQQPAKHVPLTSGTVLHHHHHIERAPVTHTSDHTNHSTATDNSRTGRFRRDRARVRCAAATGLRRTAKDQQIDGGLAGLEPAIRRL